MGKGVWLYFMKVHFSSKSNEWATPWDLYIRIERRYGPFDLDPCCTDMTAKCNRYITQKEDGLKKSWKLQFDDPEHTQTRVFMNPPYGREIGKWVQKAYEESLKGVTVVCLIPSRTDTQWWHKYCMKAVKIDFIKGRIKFEQNGKTGTVSAPFPSCLVVFSSTLGKISIDRMPVMGIMDA